MGSSCVLDASAVLALLNDEPGAAVVQEALLAGAVVASVNLSEVVAKLVDSGLSPVETRQVVSGLGLDVRDFDTEQAYEAGFLRVRAKEAGLSLGDRACTALAAILGLAALTADRSWLDAGLPVEIRAIR